MRELMHTLMWDVTDECNLRCIHCYNADKYFRRTARPSGGQTLSTQEALSVVEQIADIGFDHIHLLGGEPLLQPDIVDIIARARGRNLRVTINTNGMLLSYSLNAELIDLGVDQVTCSLDGADGATNDRIRGKGTFKKVTENIRGLSEQVREAGSDLKVLIAFVMTRLNVRGIPKLPSLAAELGAKLVALGWLYECGNASKHVGELQPGFALPQEYVERAVIENWRQYPQVRLQLDCRPRFATYITRKYCIPVMVNPMTNRCVAGEYTWLLEADGHVHPCGVMSTHHAENVRRSGRVHFEWINVRDVDAFEKLPRSEYWQSFIRFRDDPASYDHIATCKACEHSDICRPCPIVHQRANRVDECLWVIEKEAELRASAARAIPRMAPRVHTRGPLDKLRIWDPVFEDYRELNQTGSRIWTLVDGEKTCGEIADKIADFDRGDVPSGQVRRDILHFLLDMRARGLVHFELDCIRDGSWGARSGCSGRR